jgi:hypothetical protein
MALLKNYTVGNTGLEIENAYHIIYNVFTERRLHDAPQPKLPPGIQRTNWNRPEITWKAGYIGRIALLVYASKDDRDNGKKPLGAIVKYAADAADRTLGSVDANLFTTNAPCELEFFIDMTSSDSVLTQAYNYLKTTTYFSGSTEI